MSFGNSVGAFFGGDGRDDDAANAAVKDANLKVTQAANNFNTRNTQLVGQNDALANTNYYGNAANVYAQQQNAASMLQRQANGTAPSAAQVQMGTGLAQANQNAQAAALSQQGGVLSGNTQRNLLTAYGQNAGNVLGQTAALRAQEQLSGQQQYAQSLNNIQNQQQNQGQLNYRQGQNALLFDANANQQGYDNSVGAAQSQLGNINQNINTQADATRAGAGALRGTVAAIGSGIATGGASTGLGQAGSMLSGGGTSRSYGMDPNTGALAGYSQNAKGEWGRY